jgi:carboxypeptidase C (cathepsin A)
MRGRTQGAYCVDRPLKVRAFLAAVTHASSELGAAKGEAMNLRAISGWLLLGLLLGPIACPRGLAQAPAAQSGAAAEKREAPDRPSRLLPADASSLRYITQGAKRLSFVATAGSLPLLGNKGEVTANIFFTAYAIDDKSQQRPVTFVFNGGPGAASAFLQLGALGPRVVNFTDNGAAAVQPVQLADNPDTWLDFTDLVFVDPVGTGYSRSATGTPEADKAFFGVDKDASTMVEFVRLYLTRVGRLLAPVLLTGESYGGFRAALIADRLLSSGIAVRGAVLVSPALEFSMLRANRFSVIPLALLLPSLAVANWELRDGPGGSLEPLAEVERFARGDYLLHLTAGISDDAKIDAALARYTGLAADVIKRHHGRISQRTFTRQFERRTDRLLSSYDATVSTPAPRDGGIHFDPILDRAVTALEPAFGQYVRSELGYKTDLPYLLLNREISEHWDYGTSATRQGFAGALNELQKARTQRPQFAVLIVHGYTDLVTPYSISRYLIDQLAPIETARPIELRVYRGGHMMYLRPASRQAFAQDVRDFYASLTKSP